MVQDYSWVTNVTTTVAFVRPFGVVRRAFYFFADTIVVTPSRHWLAVVRLVPQCVHAVCVQRHC